MDIYNHTTEDRTPYTYRIKWTDLNVSYYGRRTSKGCRPEDLFVSYFTSSKYVKQYIKKYGNPDVIEIRKIFDNVSDCIDWEIGVLRKLKITNTNPKWLNKNICGKFDTSGKSVAKCAISGECIGSVPLADPRWQTGEIVGIQKGKPKTSGSTGRKWINKDVVNLYIDTAIEDINLYISSGWNFGRNLTGKSSTKGRKATWQKTAAHNKNKKLYINGQEMRYFHIECVPDGFVEYSAELRPRCIKGDFHWYNDGTNNYMVKSTTAQDLNLIAGRLPWTKS